MTTVAVIIRDAYREGNMPGSKAQPNGEQAAEGLSSLQRLVSGVYGYDVGERLTDWDVGLAGYNDPPVGWTEQRWQYLPANSRVVLNHTSPQTLYLPECPENGARMQFVDLKGELAAYNVTINANGRLIAGAASAVLVTDNINVKFMYDDNSGNWVMVEGLALVSEMPFPIEFDDYFITKLAGRLNPRYGRSFNDLTVQRMLEMEGQLAARYRQTRNVQAPLAVQNLYTPNRFGYFRSGRNGWMS